MYWDLSGGLEAAVEWQRMSGDALAAKLTPCPASGKGDFHHHTDYSVSHKV